VQLTAENLSGIVIHQLAHPGSPIIFGGSPAAFDMRKGTTPMGAVETMMIAASYVQVGKHLGLPTHAYMGLSNAKIVASRPWLVSITICRVLADHTAYELLPRMPYTDRGGIHLVEEIRWFQKVGRGENQECLLVFTRISLKQLYSWL